MLSVLTATLLPLFLIVGATLVVGRFVHLEAETLSRASIYLLAPALILSSITGGSLALAEVGSLLLAALLLCVVLAVLSGGVARLARLDERTGASFMLTVFIMNAGNFGLPFTEFAFGQAGLERALIFMVGTAVAIHTLGVYVASRGEAGVRASLRNVVTTPLVYAVVLALVINLSGQELPLPVARAVGLLGQAVVPVQLVVLGLQLQRVLARGPAARVRWQPVALATVSRFGLGMVLGVAIAALFRLDGLSRQVFILEASMPAGVMSGVLTETFGGDPDFTATTILVTTVASSVVLSGLLLLL